MNISSAIVHTRSGQAPRVRAALQQLAGVEVHAATDDGRLIITFEGESDGDIVQVFDRIQQTEGVLSAALVYHRFESDPHSEISLG